MGVRFSRGVASRSKNSFFSDYVSHKLDSTVTTRLFKGVVFTLMSAVVVKTQHDREALALIVGFCNETDNIKVRWLYKRTQVDKHTRDNLQPQLASTDVLLSTTEAETISLTAVQVSSTCFCCIAYLADGSHL